MTRFVSTMIHLLAGLALFVPGIARAQTPNAKPKPLTTSVDIYVSRNVAPGPKIRLNFNTKNVPGVVVTLYKLPSDKILDSATNNRSGNGAFNPNPAFPLPKPVRGWMVNIRAKNETPRSAQSDVYRSKQTNLPVLPSGLYFLTASGGGKTATAYVNITNLAVIVQRAPRRALVWVTDHQTGKVVAGARLHLYKTFRADKTPVRFVLSAEARSGADGAAIFEAAPTPNEILLVERDGAKPDAAFVETGASDPDGALSQHFQTDRPIYRPGQTVFYKSILRRTKGQEYTPVAGESVKIEVRDSRETVIEQTTAKTTRFGTVSGSVELPQEGALGQYSVVLTVGKETQYGAFTVAEYRKPEFKVTVAPEKKRYLSGEKVAFNVNAAYYFGAALPQAEIKWSVTRTPNSYYGGDAGESWYANGDGNLYPGRDTNTEPRVGDGTAYTDAQGNARIEVPAQAGLPDMTYSITLSVTDAQRRQMGAGASVPVYGAAVRLAIRAEAGTLPLGSVLPVTLRLVDLDNKPVAGNVTLFSRHSVYNEKKKAYEDVELSRSTVKIPASGRASANIPMNAQGNIEIVAETKDAGGRKSVAETSVYAADPNYKPIAEEKEPTLDLRLDKRTYKPGDTARVFVTTNTPGKPVLVSLVGDDIFAYKVYTDNKRVREWRVPTTPRHSPNAFIQSVQWARPSRQVSANATLLVPDPARELVVRVTLDKPAAQTYKPGDTAVYTIRTTDTKNKPVPAELAFGVVDESVYAVRPDTTPDPLSVFWGYRQNKTQTASASPEEVSGGAYQRAEAQAAPAVAVRERFLDTALWRADIQTDANGLATVRVPLPGNLTTWRATALGVTPGTMVGRTTATAVATRPLTMRIATPRRLVQGDALTLIGTVNNRTTTARRVRVVLQAENGAAGADVARVLDVPAKGEAKTEWRIAADTLSDAPAKFTATAVAENLLAGENAADLSDGIRLSVPVVPNGVSERIVKSGVLQNSVNLTLTLPDDKIEPATLVTVRVRGDLRTFAEQLGHEAERGYLSDVSGAASRLRAVALLPNPVPKAVRELIVFLAKTENSDGGWGWWENAPSDAAITAQVLMSLTSAREDSVARAYIGERLRNRAIEGAKYALRQTSLADRQILLTAALLAAGADVDDKPYPFTLKNITGESVSPYTRLVAAEWLAEKGKDEAAQIRAGVLASVVEGDAFAYVPAGDRPGWRATTRETTAQALLALHAAGDRPELTRKMAQWLATPGENGDDGSFYYTGGSATAYALMRYRRSRSDPPPVALTLSVNGKPLALTPERFTPGAFVANIPRDLLVNGANSFLLAKNNTNPDEMFVTVEATVYRPQTAENASGMRVLRRWETTDAFGNWHELGADGVVGAAKPVRVTVVAWPDDTTEAIKISQPLPAGFEFVESEVPGYGREEVRDGALIHYLQASGGRPIVLRYYLRAESEGVLHALPASGEVLRRADVRGNSRPETLTVRDEKAAKP